MDINSSTKSEDRVLDLKRAILRGDDALGDHLCFESIRHSDEFGRGPLHWAVECGRIGVINELVAHGADVNLRDESGMTPFLLAAALGKGQEMKMLNDAAGGRSMTTTTTKENWSALHIGCRNRHWYIVQIALIKGVNPNTKDVDGRTALHYAVEWGHAEAVARLLRHKASPSIVDNSGRVALNVESELYRAAQRYLVRVADDAVEVMCYEVRCPECPVVDGRYHASHEECYQRTGSDFMLLKDAIEQRWSITNGTQYLLRAVDDTHCPAMVSAWICCQAGSRKFFPAPGTMVRKLVLVRQHAGCDECGAEPILGAAYFCVGRHDYQMCERCESGHIRPPFPTIKVYARLQTPLKIKYEGHSAEPISEMPTFNFHPEIFHHGVTCSACQMSPIVGARYMCAVRPDYHLCSACEASTADKDGAHPHAMIKIYDPKHHPKRVNWEDVYGQRYELECAPLLLDIISTALPQDGTAVCDHMSDPVEPS